MTHMYIYTNSSHYFDVYNRYNKKVSITLKIEI